MVYDEWDIHVEDYCDGETDPDDVRCCATMTQRGVVWCGVARGHQQSCTYLAAQAEHPLTLSLSSCPPPPPSIPLPRSDRVLLLCV